MSKQNTKKDEFTVSTSSKIFSQQTIFNNQNETGQHKNRIIILRKNYCAARIYQESLRKSKSPTFIKSSKELNDIIYPNFSRIKYTQKTNKKNSVLLSQKYNIKRNLSNVPHIDYNSPFDSNLGYLSDRNLTNNKNKNFFNTDKNIDHQSENFEDLTCNDNFILRDEIFDLKEKIENLNKEIKNIKKSKNIRVPIEYEDKEKLIKRNKDLEKINNHNLKVIKTIEKFIKNLEYSSINSERNTKIEEKSEKNNVINEVEKDNKNKNNASLNEKEDIIKKYEEFSKKYTEKNEELNNKVIQAIQDNSKLTLEIREKECQNIKLESQIKELQNKRKYKFKK